MISLGIGEEPISLRDLLSDWLPNAKVGKRSMDEDDGFAGALLDIGQANAVDLDFFGQWAHAFLLILLNSFPPPVRFAPIPLTIRRQFDIL
jgi:hypothetical protein